MNYTNSGIYHANENGVGVLEMPVSYDVNNFIKDEPNLTKNSQAQITSRGPTTGLNSLVTNSTHESVSGNTSIGLPQSRNRVQPSMNQNFQHQIGVQGISIEPENFPKKEESSGLNSTFNKNNGQNMGMTSNEDKFSQWGSFHNPFDISSYPITNPPIFDSTMMLPYDSNDGAFRRRRISISNGQIGQIVNHEAFFENEITTPEFASPNPLHDNINTPSTHQNSLTGQATTINSVNQQQQQQPISTLSQEPLSGHIEQSSVSDKPILTSVAAPHQAPQYQIIYNNEVISTLDGPMPGTAAWKKERLLERNRVAASKCRQRKKQIQRQLQTKITEYEEKEKKSKIKINKYEKVLKFYNDKLKDFLNGKSDNLEALKKFIDIDGIDEVKEEDLV